MRGTELVYILINRSFPGLVKIGRTDRDAEERARELSAHTGVPTAFKVFKEFRVDDSVSIERAVHQRLDEYRVANNREFFEIEPEQAAAAIEQLIGDPAPVEINYDKEDRLLAEATKLLRTHGRIWPSMLSGALRISLSEADAVMAALYGRGLFQESGKTHDAGRR